MSKQLSLLLPIDPKPSKLTAADIDRMFAEFWAVYPRKADRRTAAKAFERVIRDGRATLSTLLQGVANYVEHITVAGTEKRFIKHPTTFLNADAWANEYDDERRESPMSAGIHRAANLRRAGSGD